MCIRWLPPMDRPSPSPVTIQMFSSGRASFRPGGERRRAAVDAVEAVGVHVVREPAGAADAGDEDGLAAVDAELGEDLLRLREDGVVAAAGTPADVLVAGVVSQISTKQLLGRHIRKRSQDQTGLRNSAGGVVVGEKERDSEVEDLRMTVRRQRDVARLEIAVKKPVAVRVVERVGDRDAEAQQIFNRQGPASRRDWSVPPPTYSMTRNSQPFLTSKSKMVATPGCERRDSTSASRRKRSRLVASRRVPCKSILMATSRSRLSSCAFHTSPSRPRQCARGVDTVRGRYRLDRTRSRRRSFGNWLSLVTFGEGARGGR